MPNGKSTDKLAVSIWEAVALTGIGRSSIYKLIKQGRLTPRKVGRRTLILIEDLEDLVRSLPTGGEANALGR